MEAELAKRMIDACYEAQMILNTMPALPEGMTPQYMRMIEVIHDLAGKEDGLRVSEIAEAMGLSLPGATRSLKGLEKLDTVERHTDREDGRAVRIVLSEQGEEWYTFYITRFYENMCRILQDVPEEEIVSTIETIHAVHQKMADHREELYEGQ
ncbi:MAG: MarR family transcriptional regulator [Solobacterium sp.]|jgi:DNA-binding MarR family transcriptional regulator|nr:MarR family transcriptional regulator [Solobacterium sp.]MCH4048785.1 MarR family transcriptional regulator [Solobacterium sp.]MCH4074461.1 MarR family transcriptional regulator [Solobacterium sp.]MCI1347209.1 MarR family transcriptional regulator [Solobacterium sp.]